MTDTYACVACSRDVDPIDEPSPGEPTRCPDCHWQAIKEDAL